MSVATRQTNTSNNLLAKIADILCGLKQVTADTTSKMERIKGSVDYLRTFTYDLVGTENVTAITHTGTTSLGIETIVETISYVNAAVNGSNVTSIAYS